MDSPVSSPSDTGESASSILDNRSKNGQQSWSENRPESESQNAFQNEPKNEHEVSSSLNASDSRPHHSPSPHSRPHHSPSPHSANSSANHPSFYSAQAALSRNMSALEAIDRAEDESLSAGYSARAFPVKPFSAQPPRQPQNSPAPLPAQPLPAQPQKRGLFWRRRALTAGEYALERPVGTVEVGLDGVASEALPETLPAQQRRWWEKQPYTAIARTLAISGTFTGAWLFGILVAQVLPGEFANPPLQEAVLRKSSRLGQRLWHFSRLWHTPMSETQIQAIPLPETGPLLAPINLPPIERQPLIDELNSVETELLTLDRRLQTLEKRLGKPPYQGASVENRVSSLRAAIDPPVRTAAASSENDYQPTPKDPNDQLLEIAQLKITLPSDALFSPGASELKDTALLNQVLDQLVNYPKATILIRSYSDNQAEAKLSRKYTQQQAIAVSEYLSASLDGTLNSTLGDTYRWVTVGGGSSQPVGSNDNDTGRQRNRRIEILVDTRARR